MKSSLLTDNDIRDLGQKVRAFTDGLSPLEQAFMEEILTRAGAIRPEQAGYTWKPDPVLALRVSLRSRVGVA